jgi:hypothetical protein
VKAVEIAQGALADPVSFRNSYGICEHTRRRGRVSQGDIARGEPFDHDLFGLLVATIQLVRAGKNDDGFPRRHWRSEGVGCFGEGAFVTDGGVLAGHDGDDGAGVDEHQRS